MNVLSLFDGISCGQLALKRAGIKIEKYHASEIKKHAIKCTMDNFPKTIQLGDVTKLDATKIGKIDLLIGGSPCQDFSRAKVLSIGEKRNGLEGNKSSLFWEYVRILNEVKPKYYLLENVIMKQEEQDKISTILGVEPIRINSNLVSYQNRDRLYWTNIPHVTIPEDKKINFQQYKDKDIEYCRKFKTKRTPSREKMWGNGIDGNCPNVTNKEKINCVTVKQDRWANSGLIQFEDFCRFLTTRELELAQTLPIGYTKMLTKNQAENVIGDGWTVDVIAHIFKCLKEVI